MNIISCDECGVILDANKLNFVNEERFYKDDGSVDEDKAGYNGFDWVAKVQCPVCQSDVLEDV